MEEKNNLVLIRIHSLYGVVSVLNIDFFPHLVFPVDYDKITSLNYE